jgi:hypothetical protein
MSNQQGKKVAAMVELSLNHRDVGAMSSTSSLIISY